MGVKCRLLDKPRGDVPRDDRPKKEPGDMWFCPWYFDPQDPADRLKLDLGGTELPGMLSEFYWRDWAKIRPPIVVVTPSGRDWCVDQKSSNGAGWVVTGEAPLITCNPSIMVPGYHGFLRDGVFTENMG